MNALPISRLEYFLHAKIIGGHIRGRPRKLLSAMLVMEAAFAIAGLIATPIYHACAKTELTENGYV